jgi:hypothetical protein
MEVTTHLDTSQMTIGDRNALEVQWVGPNEIERIRFSTDAWDSLPAWSWLNKAAVLHEEKKGEHHYSKRLSFTVFDTLKKSLPTLSVRWEEEGEMRSTKIGPLHLEVIPPELNEEDWAENMPIIKEPLRWEDYRLYLFGCILLIALYYLYRYYRKTTATESPIEKEQLIDPHEEAYIALQHLEDENWIEKEKYEPFQRELSRIIRHFLSRKYDLRGMESTTRELIQQLEGTSFPQRKAKTLKELLNMADLVKFARAEPPGDYHRRMLLEARQLVEQTNHWRS